MPEHTPAPTPSRAVYGFALYLSFKLFFVIYLIWAVVPEQWFEFLEITFMPQRYWAIAIPIFLLTILTTFAFVIYPNLGVVLTPDIDDLKTITDYVSSKNEKFHLNTAVGNNSFCICKNKKKCMKNVYDKYMETCNIDEKKIPKLRDLNMWDVSEQLYL